MRILISNDDGINSEGLHVLAQNMEELAHVTVVAPQMERSTTGHSLTIHKPLRCKQVKPNYYWLSGSPADCIYFATRHLLKEKPDLIISGINFGANLGSDIFYSGTVAAAREGALYGVPSIAVSLVLPSWDYSNELHWKSAAEFIKILAPQVIKDQFPAEHIVNVNVPNLPMSQIKGVKVGRQGRRTYSDNVSECIDPRNKKYYWIGGTIEGHMKIPNTDCVHVEEGYISVVPLKTDTTSDELREKHRSWEDLL